MGIRMVTTYVEYTFGCHFNVINPKKDLVIRVRSTTKH
jgi:hypothetical protein